MNWEKAVNRDREVSYQARLNKKLESKVAYLSDNAILNNGKPEDVLLVKEVKNVNGTTISTVTSGHIVTNFIMPVLKNIPIQKIKGKGKYALTSLIAAHGEGEDSGKKDNEVTTFEARVPLSSDIEIGNKVIKVFVQEGVLNTVMVFDVVNVLADYSDNAPISMKVVMSLSTKPIDVNKDIYQKVRLCILKNTVRIYK